MFSIESSNQLKESYYRDSFYQNKNDQEKLRKVINELAFIKKKQKVIPSQLISDDKIVLDPQSICEIMKNFFVNVGKNPADKIHPVTNKPSSFHDNLPRVKHCFFFSPASPDEIATIIRSLKSKKSKRENDIETKFLKHSNVVISPVICNIFNSCIEQGKFPDSIKIDEVVPIFKKGGSIQANNYRPISLLSQFSKVLEKLICNRLHHYVENYNLLSKHLYGFRRNSSSTHTLCNIYEKLLKRADNILYTC